MANKKKKRIRLKKSARRTIGVLLLIMALVVALIPTPQNAAAGKDAEPIADMEPYVSNPSASGAAADYETLDYDVTYDDTAYNALTIEMDSNGDWKMTNGFELHLTKASSSGKQSVTAGNGVVTDYNHNSTADSLIVKPRVVTYFPLFEEDEVRNWLETHKEDVIAWNGGGTYYGDYEYYFGKDADDKTYQDWVKAKEEYDAMTPEEREEKGKTDPGTPSRPDKKLENLTGDQQFIYFCYHFTDLGTSDPRSLLSIRDRLSNLYNNAECYKMTKVTDETTPISGSATGISSRVVFIPCNTMSSDDDYNNRFFTKDENRIYIYYIADRAFKGATYRNISIPKEILQIGNEAFMDCKQLTNVSAYAGIIGNRAFYNCTSLSSVDIENGKCTAIDTECFYNCNSLRSITFPNGIQHIGKGAFAECDYLREVNLGNVTGGFSLYKYAFYNCPAISSVTLAKDGEEGHMKEIQDGAFALVGLSPSGSWTKITFPISVDTLGDYVLYGRENLEEVTMPGGYGATKEVTLPDGFFARCISLKKVIFPENAGRVKFGGNAFADVAAEDFYVQGPKYYSGTNVALERQSSWNAGIPYVYIENGAEHWEYGADGYLFDIDTNDGTLISCTVMDESAFAASDNTIVIPAKVGDVYVTGIGSTCFDNASVRNDLKHLVVPDDTRIEAIQDSAFEGFPSLESVEIGDSVKTIGNKSFYNCPVLKLVKVGDGLTSVGSECFATPNGTALEQVYFGKNLQTIGDKAFDKCKKLREVVFASPDSYNTMQSIPDSAFATGGKELTFYGDIDEEYAPFVWAMKDDNFVDADKLLRVCYKSGTPEYPNLTVIKDNASLDIVLVDYPHYEDLPAETRTKYEKYISGSYTDASEIAMTADESRALDHVLNIIVPEGIRSIDVKAFIYEHDNGNDVSTYLAGSKNYVTYRQYGLFNGYYGSEDGIFASAGSDPVPNVYAMDETLLAYEEMGYAILGGAESELREYPVGDSHELVARGNDRVLSINLNDVEYLPDDCFYSCENLQSVVLGDDLREMGESPFAGCTKLTSVGGNEIFQCENGIIFQQIGGGETIVECLSSRGSLVGDSTINAKTDRIIGDVNNIRDGAFKDCKAIFSIDLSDSNDLEVIPKNAFEGCDSLMMVTLPESVDEILADSFANTNRYINVTIPATEVYIADDAFSETAILHSYEGSAVEKYCNKSKLNHQFVPITNKYAVYFLDFDGTRLCEVQYVNEGSAAEPPTVPKRTGYTFDSWSVDYTKIFSDTIIVARYTVDKEAVLSVSAAPTLTSAALTQSANLTNAALTNGAAKKVSPTANPSQAPATSPAASPGAVSPVPAVDTQMYTLTVVNGSGSGSYRVGTSVNISAFAPQSGYEFKNWTSTSNDFNIVSSLNSVTTITMPGHDLTITANFDKAGHSGNNPETTPGGGGGGGGSSDNPSGGGGESGTGTIHGTTVQISKPGISNKDLANAYVNGSSDNFLVRITDTDAARYAVEQALIEQYGSLDNLSYYAMDITLYDESGTTKIEDTTGLTVTVTMPIPDDLVKYAGNNQVMAVVNGTNYEALEGRFTTISGVPCISFTATHFSPYAIYVDRAHLSGGVVDETPKTGDGIHPKYFIAVALACGAIIMLLKKDKKEKRKSATA